MVKLILIDEPGLIELDSDTLSDWQPGFRKRTFDYLYFFLSILDFLPHVLRLAKHGEKSNVLRRANYQPQTFEKFLELAKLANMSRVREEDSSSLETSTSHDETCMTGGSKCQNNLTLSETNLESQTLDNENRNGESMTYRHTEYAYSSLYKTLLTCMKRSDSVKSSGGTRGLLSYNKQKTLMQTVSPFKDDTQGKTKNDIRGNSSTGLSEEAISETAKCCLLMALHQCWFDDPSVNGYIVSFLEAIADARQ